jgi:hypothetical protein
VLVFIDESGDEGFKFGGGSSALFCFAAMIFESQSASDEMANRIGHLRQKIGRSANKEFHFKNESKPTKEAILEMLDGCDFGYIAIVVEKKHLNPDEFAKPSSLRLYAIELLIDAMVGYLNDKAILTFDECGGKKTQKLIRKSVRQRCRKRNCTQITRVNFQRSRSCDLLQMADSIANAINHSFQKADGKGKYHKALEVRELCLEVWPKMEHEQ